MTIHTTINEQDLPIWMQQARQEFDWGILIALAMSIAMAWTFLLRTDLPAGHQLEHYMFQAADTISAIEEGRLYPRWSPYTINGYGAPVPNYYPMGASYTIALVNILFTDDLHQAVRIVFIASYAIAGVGAYLWVSRRTNAGVGLLTSLIYIYSPMIGSTIPYMLGDIALMMAGALLPLSLWSGYRVIVASRPIDFTFHSLVVLFLLWVYPAMLFMSIAVSIVYVLCDEFDNTFVARLKQWLIPTIVGCLLASFFWLPALLERDLVTWYEVENSVTFQLTLNELVSPMQQIDAGLLTPQSQFKLGILIVIFNGFSFFIPILTRQFPQRFSTIALCIGVTMCALALWLFSQETWLLVPITLCFATSGASVLYLRKYLSQSYQRLLLAFTIALTLIFGLPIWLIPAPHLTVGETDAISQIRFEQNGYGYASIPEGLPLPSTINPTTPISRFLLNSLDSNSPQRYDEQQNTAETIVSLLNTSTHEQSYRISNSIPRTLEFLLPYFEGWQVYVNEEPADSSAHPTTNMIQTSVPIADSEELRLVLGATPIRTLSWIVTFIGLIFLVSITVIRNRTYQIDSYQIVTTMHRTDVRLMLFMFIFLSIIIVIITSDNPLIQLRNPPTFTLAQSLPLQNRTSAGFEATTFEIDKVTVQRNDQINITINWQALTIIQSNHKSRAKLRDVSNQLVWYTGDLQSPSPVASRRWVRNTYITDKHQLPIPEDVIPGEYEILIELFPCQIICNLDLPVTFFDINGNSIGQQLIIPITIQIQ